MKTQKKHIGENSLNFLKDYLRKNGIKRLLVFHGKASFQQLDSQLNIISCLEEFSPYSYSNFSSNPQIDEIKDCIREVKEFGYDAILAIGGGSVIDFAKIVFFYVSQEQIIDDFDISNFRQPSQKFIAIPTTAGTGSESTQFATYYENGIKKSLDHKSLLPDLYILDANFSRNLPPKITAETGVDALCQAIESLWNVRSDDESKHYAKNAIKIIVNELKNAVRNPSVDCRLQMLIASNEAGKAIQITRTTAPHAISYPITSFHGVPHGQAVSLTLPQILKFNAGVSNADCNDPRGFSYVKKLIEEISELLGYSGIDSACSGLTEFFSDIGLKTSLSSLGITQKDIEKIVEHGFTPNRVKNNPRNLNKEQLNEILVQIL